MSVRYRSDRDAWEVSVLIRGKRKRPLFQSKREAQDFFRKYKLGKLGFKEGEQSILLNDAIASYYETESARKSAKSKENEKRYFNFAFHFFTVERGIEYLDQIELDDLQTLEQWLLRSHKLGDTEKRAWTQATVSRFSHTLKHFFVKMVRTKKLKEDPARYWTVSAGEPNRRRPMTAAEYGQLYAASPGWYRSILKFIRLTGARASSIVRLSWADVDLTRRVLKLKSMKGRKAEMKETFFPIFDDLFTLLVSERNKRPFTGEHDAVFRNESGDPITATWISREGGRLIRKCRLSGVVLYGLRHALATDMTEAGVPLEITRQAMGHASVQMTQHYAQGIGIASVGRAIQSVRMGATETDLPPIATKTE